MKDSIVSRIEAFIARFSTFTDSALTLPIALWILGTFCFESFDAFPYVVVTSATKRSGKTRLAELIGFLCARPKQFGAMTAFTLFQTIDTEKPTIFFDEAEVLSSESANNMRAVLNMGYRRGQSVPRQCAKWWNPELENAETGELGAWSSVREFKTYCPKVFILIGDVFDTLKDRSIIITMRRGEPRERFVYELAKTDAEQIRERAKFDIRENLSRIQEAYINHKGLSFLTDRDEEIWTPLFVLASIFCPERMTELQHVAVDLSTEKTQEKKTYVNLLGEEKKAQDDEYAIRLLRDVNAVMGVHKHFGTQRLLESLKQIPAAPWRKYSGGRGASTNGTGLSVHNMADMLSRFGVKPTTIRKGKQIMKGYKSASVSKALAILERGKQ